MSWSKIGVVTKPQALKGQFRLKPSLLNMKTYKKINVVKINERIFNVESVALRDVFAIFKLEGIDTCEQAENLRNQEVFAEVEIDTQEHFDLVDFTVVIDNLEFGVIKSVDNFGSKDILSVSGKRSFMIPVIDGLIVSTNENNKTITFNSNIFEQVVVYED